MDRRKLLLGAAGVLAARGTARATPSPELSITGFKGRLIGPADPAYEAARRGASFGPAEDRRPSLIAQCADAEDVRRAIAYARETALPLAVKAGGHDVLAACVVDRGVVIDLTAMDGIVVDAEHATARVSPGVRCGAFAARTKAHGLAPALSCEPHVGVAGLTLGGGLGWLSSAYGAACDNLLEAELLTPDGRLLTASAQSHPDLFWALRGGGGNFGVVTSMTFRLQPVQTVLAGALGLRGDPGALLRAYRDLVADAPRGLSVELSFAAGRPATMIAICCWSGGMDASPRIAERLQAFGKPAFGAVRPLAYGDFAAGLPAPPSAGGLFWRGGSLDSLGDGAIERLAHIVSEGPPGLSLGLGHHLHGAVCEPAEATPLRRPKGQLSYFIGAGWRKQADAPGGIAAVREAMALMAPVSSRATYVNYLSRDDEASVQAAYGAATYARLQTIKRRYDPANVFRGNRNIRPRRAA